MGDRAEESQDGAQGQKGRRQNRSTWDRLSAMAMDVLFASMPVADLEAAVPWYEQLFGRPPDIVPNASEVMWRVTDSGWIYVILDEARAGQTVVTISVADLESSVTELAERGVRPGPIEAIGEAGRKSTSLDLDGNAISLIEVAAPH